MIFFRYIYLFYKFRTVLSSQQNSAESKNISYIPSVTYRHILPHYGQPRGVVYLSQLTSLLAHHSHPKSTVYIRVHVHVHSVDLDQCIITHTLLHIPTTYTLLHCCSSLVQCTLIALKILCASPIYLSPNSWNPLTIFLSPSFSYFHTIIELDSHSM